MDENLAARFEADRPRLQAVAYRMLGSVTAAEDAVQETWLRLSRSDAESIDNLGGWLTTVTSRVCLGMLRTRRSRVEELLDDSDIAAASVEVSGPEDEVVLADTMGPALLFVLETLSPAERLAFVLHDLFGVPFDEIAPIVDRSPAATRQLASRARRRVRGGDGAHAGDRRRQREVVEAFLAASREGDFEALAALLDPDAVMRADGNAIAAAAANQSKGAPLLAAEVRGGTTVANVFIGRARAAKIALIDGVPGAVWAPGGRPRAIFAFRVVSGVVVEIEVVTEPAVVAALPVTIL